MPARLRCPAKGLCLPIINLRINTSPGILLYATASPLPGSLSRQYATASGLSALRLPDDYVPPTQPPSARPADVRKTQLLRSYTSLLRSTPLMLIFQHNNLTAAEWVAIRRELRAALSQVPPVNVTTPEGTTAPLDLATHIQMQVIRSRSFGLAMKIVEFYDPNSVTPPPQEGKGALGKKSKVYTHDLSKTARAAIEAISDNIPADSVYAQLQPVLTGPLALLNFPVVSPAHLATALSVLAPKAPAFPAPPRRKNPGYYDPVMQTALQKLLLIGGRVEGRVFDMDGVRWVGGIEGGLDSLRAQLVHMLQSAGLGLTTALEGAGKNLWLTMESRRSVLEEEEKGGKPEEAKQES